MAATLRPFWGWIIALVCSILLNVIFFGFMPRFIQRIPDTPDALKDIKQVQVIRFN